MSILYSPATLGPLKLQNHLVMAPMTRNRAIGKVGVTGSVVRDGRGCGLSVKQVVLKISN